MRSQVKEGTTASESVFEGVNRLPNKNGEGGKKLEERGPRMRTRGGRLGVRRMNRDPPE